MQAELIPWSGQTFRCVHPEFASTKNLFNGDGAFITGGRWNPPRLFRTNYCSLSPGAAAEEAYRLFEIKGIPRTAIGKRIIVPIYYELQHVWDFSQFARELIGEAIHQALHEEWEILNTTHFQETLGQCFGRTACSLGAEAMLLPSARVPGGINLVIFPDFLDRRSSATLENEKIFP